MPSDSAERKSALRRAVRAERQRWRESASAGEVQARAASLAHDVLHVPAVAAACAQGRVVTCFASLPTEPPTQQLLDALLEAGADVVLPIVRPERQLHWARYSGPDDLVPAGMDIPEPSGTVVATSVTELLSLAPTVLLIPALAVDDAGVRLGQGGGFYDTLLAALPTVDDGGPVVIAIIGPEGALPAGTIPKDAHDRPVSHRIIG